MAFFEDMFSGNPVTGALVGIGALMVAPTVVPAVGRVLRPAAKAVIKGGIVLYRETIAEVGEAASDLFAEARAELEKGNSHGRPAAAGTAPTARPEAH